MNKYDIRHGKKRGKTCNDLGSGGDVVICCQLVVNLRFVNKQNTKKDGANETYFENKLFCNLFKMGLCPINHHLQCRHKALASLC